MKKLLLILIMLPFFSLAQQYSEVIETPGKTSDQLYSSAREWFALTFKSAKDVIQLEDPAEKKIIGKGFKVVNYNIKQYQVPLDMYFTLSVQFKDNRYKYDIETTELKTSGGESYTYDQLKYLTTVDGVTENLKSKGAVPWVIGKKQIQATADANKLAIEEVDKQLLAIIFDLDEALCEKSEDDW